MFEETTKSQMLREACIPKNFYNAGLPRKNIRSINYTTGRQLLDWIENSSMGDASVNPKCLNSKQRQE
jgi:hypothetical protein